MSDRICPEHGVNMTRLLDRTWWRCPGVWSEELGRNTRCKWTKRSGGNR